ncbi:MAG TPA: PqiC family protein [Candidatus Binataceae bacterium]|nr:PqiC family protein [Candidatus Binataceae bacterium]
MRRRLSVTVAAAALGALAAGGCFSPRPDPSKFFVLAPAGAAANSIAPAGLATSSSPTIGIGPIKLPEYLDRDEVVTRVGPNRLELSDKDRWAEPLDNNFKQVIAQDLTQSLGTHSIAFYPWYGTTRVDYQVRIDVYRFETDPSANAQLVAHWQVLDGSGKLLYAADSNLTEQAQPAEPVAAALSRTVDRLARQIASAIQSLPPRRQPGHV